MKAILFLISVSLTLSACSKSEKNQNSAPADYGDTAPAQNNETVQDTADANRLKSPSGMPAQSEPNVATE